MEVHILDRKGEFVKENQTHRGLGIAFREINVKLILL